MKSWLQVPLQNDTTRKIVHIDMDAFYASIEERQNPQLKQKALVIAKDPRITGGKGVVTTANYVARQYGVHSAMSAAKAQKLLPSELAVFKTPDFELYRQVSKQIHQVFQTVTDKIEPIAFDEAYLDITENKLGLEETMTVVTQLQRLILAKTQLVSSAGISYNKFLAKMASDYQKPAGRTLVLPEEAIAFLSQLPIKKFRGVGQKTVEKMYALNIFNGADLLAQNEFDLMYHFGKLGYQLYRQVRGIDNRPVIYQRQNKSVGNENTYAPALMTQQQVELQLEKIATQVAKRLHEKQLHGQTIVIKIRQRNFETITRRKTLDYFIDDASEIYRISKNIWQETGQIEAGIRLLGITVTNLVPKGFENILLDL